LCEDYIVSNENNLSVIKILDMVKPDELPYNPPKLVLIATFFRNPSIEISRFIELAPEIKVVIRNPSGALIEIGEFPISKISETKPWLVERLILNLSGGIQLNSSGGYFFEVYGRVHGGNYEHTHLRLMPVAKPRNLKIVNS
jgi:hypothetical protein